MPYRIAWLIPDVVIEATTAGTITLDDFNNTCRDLVTEINKSAANAVFVLVDITEASTLDFTVGQLFDSSALDALANHPRLCYVAYFDDRNPYYVMIIQLLLHRSGMKGNIFSHREDALDHLRGLGAPL